MKFAKKLKKIAKKFGSNKKMPTFAIPNNKAVVVKWSTRYFEGVVGVILCEFESRPPHPDTREEISKEVSSLSFLCNP